MITHKVLSTFIVYIHFGKITGDKELEAKGFIEKTIAKGKELADDAKDAVEGAVDAVKEKLK
ncbi:CsbD family protein [Streptococcus agalactiae]|uniref:CsbD family protein n=1 Tax=Streptococcus agalactiae TaxID=1311 RepID=UPI000E1C39C4|nr:CsbD family protein [Streptococcus agalactiae]